MGRFNRKNLLRRREEAIAELVRCEAIEESAYQQAQTTRERSRKRRKGGAAQQVSTRLSREDEEAELARCEAAAEEAKQQADAAFESCDL